MESSPEKTNLKNWWASLHKTNNAYFLSSDIDPEKTWQELNIVDKLILGKAILQIGIGVGSEAKSLYIKGLKVYLLDICIEAFDKVKDFVCGTFLSNELDKLPPNFFDLAVSHLVAQHMNDFDLQYQIQHVLRSLKCEGVFAMQFANYVEREPDVIDKDRFEIQSEIHQRFGEVVRSEREFTEMVEKVGGKITWHSCPYSYKDLPKDSIIWHFVHIQKR